jgi:hypothetical protein
MTFQNKEGDPGHLLFDYDAYYLWFCLFILYRLLEHHIIKKIYLIAKKFCSCITPIELLVSDIISDEKLPEYWNALTGDD